MGGHLARGVWTPVDYSNDNVIPGPATLFKRKIREYAQVTWTGKLMLHIFLNAIVIA